eukprot:TRINITY_DN2905_c0_g1_i1.p1 TRINITY_DN2905_c0_g1~~TRINITY_DN2905_c0_g1_i1.p1  ORF type:complete len:110 (-),score=10.53 TRINITY_DN2905_c0_g1_i1:417-746(-)
MVEGVPAYQCPEGHEMAFTDYAGPGYLTGYRCDLCAGHSKHGHCGGGRLRWGCRQCEYDVCFECYPKEGPPEDKFENLDLDLADALASYEQELVQIQDQVEQISPQSGV